MKKTIVVLTVGISLMFSASAAYANFFSVGLDVPLQYTLDDGDKADDISGFKVTLALPFFVGFGFEDYTATFNTSSVETEVEISFVDLFVNLPIPLIIIGVGVGILGHCETDTSDRPACAGMTGFFWLTAAVWLTGIARILRKAEGDTTASTPVINNQTAAGMGTADGVRRGPPATPGVPMSLEP